MSFSTRHFPTAWLLFMLLLSVLPVSRARAGEAEDQYTVAAGHYAAGRWQLAIDEFDKFLRATPEHARAAQAIFFSGEAFVQLGRLADADERFEQLLDQYPSSSFARQALFRRAEAAYVAGRHKPARKLLDEFEAKYSDNELNAYALPYLAELMLEERDCEAARRLFAKALDVYPAGPLVAECRLGLAKADEALGRVEEARRAYREMSAADAAVADQAQLQWGALENAAGEYDAALTAFAPFADKLKSSPLAEKAALGRGWALYKLKSYAAAETCFDELVKRDATNFEACYWLAVTRAADQRWADAIEPLRAVEAGAQDPTRVMQCRAALSICYAHAQRDGDARAAYEAFAENQPGAELWNSTTYQLAEAAFRHDIVWAAELFRSLCQEGNAADYVAKGLSGLAWCQFQSADTAGSAATFERLLVEYPNDPLAAEAALVRGQALEKLGQSDPALTMYELVIDKYPASRQLSEALWRAGRVEQRLARTAQAEARYRRLAEQRPPFGQYDALLYHWSRALDELDQHQQAADLLERLRRDWPQSALAADAAYRLAERELSLKNYEQAAALLREIVAAEPALKILPQALYLQARVALARDEWQEARTPLERLVHDFPDSSLVLAARYWIAEATYRQKQFQRAADEFAALDHDTPGRSEKWLAMVPLRHAQSLAQLGRWPEALSVASAIEKRYPDFEDQYEADYVVGRALANQAEFSAAREAYARVIRSPRGAKTETAAMAQWMTGETFFHQENFEAAIAAYLRVEILYAYPKWQAGALLQAGKCQETVGRWKEAAEIYARLIQTYPETEFTDEAKRRLSLAQQHRTQRS
jgi:cellulose synthase operon protein C